MTDTNSEKSVEETERDLNMKLQGRLQQLTEELALNKANYAEAFEQGRMQAADDMAAYERRVETRPPVRADTPSAIRKPEPYRSGENFRKFLTSFRLYAEAAGIREDRKID